jgi:sugar O-acyltransferase (sialic acid O-acetyltransferase NeuD family)
MTGPDVSRRTPLLFVGAGGLAREAAEAARAAGRHELIGFLDDDPARWGTSLVGLPVLGGLEQVGDHPRAELLLCPGHGRSRALLRGRLARHGVSDERYATVIHPRAEVPGSCTVGAGSVLLAGVVLTADVSVGRHVAVMPNAVLTHDDVIEDYVSVCASVALAGCVRIREGTYLGQGCLVREGLTVGAWSVVGMGAAVTRDVGDAQVWAGVPARLLRPSAGRPLDSAEPLRRPS